MPDDSRRNSWDKLTDDQWKTLAEGWLAELDDAESVDTDFGQSVVLMNFTGRASQQWKFIELCVSLADSEDQLGGIAAGPLEHLLGRHGEEYIDDIEAKAVSEPKFAHMVRSAWRHQMSDEVWDRLQAIQNAVSDN